MSSKKTNHATNKKFPARFLPANCAEISKVTSGAEIGFCRTQKRSIGNTGLVFVYEIRL